MDALYHGRIEEAVRAVAEIGEGNLTLHEAAAMGLRPRLEQLLGQDPQCVNAWSADGFQPLQLAAFFGRTEAAELLLARGGDVASASQNTFSVTALHAALAGSAPEIARSLISAGADVNARQQDGVTPLHEAAAIGNEDLTRLLLERGADQSTTDGRNRTAADHARERGYEAIAQLLERGG
jgi:ankyrin repeat protein